MSLTRLEREIITDSLLKIQSIEASLDQLNEIEIIDLNEIHTCLKSANASFRMALNSGASQNPTKR
jgi:hypothetical protein